MKAFLTFSQPDYASKVKITFSQSLEAHVSSSNVEVITLCFTNGVGGTMALNHAKTHGKGCKDEIKPQDIGAATSNHGHKIKDVENLEKTLIEISDNVSVKEHSHQIGDVVGLDDRLTELENRPGGGGGGIPDAHASSHAESGSDPITPDSIGASAKAHTHDERYHPLGGDLAKPLAMSEQRLASVDGGYVEIKTGFLDGVGAEDPPISGGDGGTTDYVDLTNKPQINGIALVGNKTLAELGAQPLIPANTYALFGHGHTWESVTNKPTTWDWSLISNKPTTFTPSAHNQAISTITDLQTTLNGKASLNGSLTQPFAMSALRLANSGGYVEIKSGFLDGVGAPNPPAGGGDGGTTDYVDLTNKPQINGIALVGNKTLAELGVPTWALQAVKPAYTASEVGALPTFNGEFISDMTKISTDGVRWYLPSTLNRPYNYGLTLDFNGSQWYYRLAFDTESGNIHYYNRINAGDYILRGTLYHTGNLAPASVNNAGNTLVQRAANGYIYGAIYHDNYPTQNSPIGQIGYRLSQENGFHHFCTPDHFKAQLGLYHTDNKQPSLPISGHNINALSYHQTNGSFEGSPSVWASYIILGHGDSSSYYDNILRFPFHEANGTPQYQRKEAGVNSGWKTFWTVENCGSSAFDWSMRNAHVNGNINIASAGRGTIQIGNVGLLTGYPNDGYPTIKTSYGYLYLDIAGKYAGAFGSDGSYFNIHSGGSANGVRVSSNLTVTGKAKCDSLIINNYNASGEVNGTSEIISKDYA